MQDGVPELPSEDTPNEEVLNVLFFLVAKRASSRMRETSPSQPICSPTLIVGNQPHKESTFGRCPSFPNACIWLKTDTP